MFKFNKIVITLVACGALGVAQAQVVGGVSTDKTQTKYIIATAGLKDGKAGIEVHDNNLPDYSPETEKALSKTANNKGQSMALMAKRADQWISRVSGIAKKDNNGVIVAKMQKMPKLTAIMPDHTGLGQMSFKQVGNADVWYGEWQNPAATTVAERNTSVFYVGSDPTTKLPSGKAQYDVKGINQYTDFDKALMTGTFTADFDKKTLQGSLSKSDLNVAVSAKISDDASFAGRARANNVMGESKGQFYGDKAESLAGITTFESKPEYNTAFGGSKK